MFHWNTFFDAFIYLNNEELYPLQIFLRAILIINRVSLHGGPVGGTID